MTNIITACFGGTRFTNTRPAWLIDHGMVLQIKGVELPDVYEVDFSNSKAETATRVLGGPDGVVIPDQYFLSNAKQIYAWVYLTTGDSGFTTLQITIPLSQRPDVSTEPPTPQETDLIEQAIAALNDGVERAETAAESAEQSAQDAAAALENVQETVDNALQEAKDSGEFDGRDGTDGEDGVTYTPNVDAAGVISWTNDGGLPNPQPRNIKGPQGDKLTYEDLTPADKADLVQGPIAEAQTAAVAAVNQAGTTQVGNVNIAGAAHVQAVEDKGEDVLASIPPDYTELSEDVDTLKSAVSDITEETRNLFSLDGLQIGKNSVGANAGPRAISKAIFVSTDAYTVSCASLPANLKYDIEAYSSNVITDRVKGITDWITSTSTDTTKTPDGTYTYIRILFGSVNNADLTEADFDGLKLQVEHGSIKTAYVEPITAVDIVARAEITELSTKSVQKISVMQFNVGHYGYGVQEGYSGDDAADVFKRYQLWLNDNACDIANINEYERYFTSDHTISAKTDLFDPVFKYAYNNLITTLFSRYELLGQTWGYLGSSDPSSQRYYVKAYVRINGVLLCLVGCHLSPAIADAPAKRAVQIADLLALVEDETNVIIFGDFNVATTDEYAPIISAGYKMANGGIIGYFGTDYTGGDTSVMHPIDNIIVSPNIYISNIKVHSDDYSQLTSDHYAVTCDLTIYPTT